MARSLRVASAYSCRPLWEPTVEEASRTAASKRTAHVAHWAHALDNSGSRLSQSDFEALWRQCPDWRACEARRVCLLAYTRAVRVWRARHALASNRTA